MVWLGKFVVRSYDFYFYFLVFLLPFFRLNEEVEDFGYCCSMRLHWNGTCTWKAEAIGRQQGTFYPDWLCLMDSTGALTSNNILWQG